MSRENKKLPRIAAVVCALSILFACGAIFIAGEMRDTSQNIYEHPYTVSNNARAMRSRLLDMKRFVNAFLIHDYVSAGETNELFEERYALQNAAIETINERYRGPEEDLLALRTAFDALIECQNEAVQYVPNHTEEEIDQYIETMIYPCYDAVEKTLDVIITFADGQILALTEQSRHAATAFILLAIFLCIVIVGLTQYSSRAERKSIEALEKRERELEDALYLAQKAGNAKKDFLSRMSHEIRTPMNVIIGMTTIASAHAGEQQRVEDCLTKIAYSSRHLLSIINDVLDMSKIEEGKLLVNRKPFELQQLIESIVAIIYPQTKEQEKNFECNIEGEVYDSYVGDFMRTNQILLNLLSNAVKFTPSGGTIRLTINQVSRKDGRCHLRFAVSDTGIGMSEDFLDKIFKPFEQADSEIATKYGGTGLGMAITYNLVELLGGSIHVKSKEGEGSTFTVELPFEVPQEAQQQRKWTMETLSVLVVDDDVDAATHASILLERMGIQAKWVQSGVEAITMVFDAHDAYRDYDVCLIDWKMPEMDGVEVTRRIRERLGPDTIIIIISAYDWSEIEKDARQAGANAFISKPLFESALYNVLQMVFDARTVKEEAQKSHVGAYRGKRFLLAEDNQINREITVELLKDTEAEMECAEDGKIALEKFLASGQGYYDAIFMDLQMPVMDGYEATKQIRASSHPDAQSIPIFAMTANAFREDVERCLNMGMDGHIPKPLEMNVLFELVDGIETRHAPE